MKKKQIITKIISVGLAAGITLFGTSFFNGSKIVQADQVANGKTIIIDAGHCGGLSSGYDVGALCPFDSTLTEADVTLDMAERLNKLLVDNGYKVVMTRRSEENLSLQERISIANNTKNAIMYISLHCNSGSEGDAQGGEVWYTPGGVGYSEQTLAENINNNMCEKTGLINRGIKEGPYYINYMNIPAVIVETGFINNKTDYEHIVNDRYKIVTGIYNGIVQTINETNIEN